MVSLKAELDSFKDNNLYRTLRNIESPQDSLVRIDGREILLFSSNNYLGLANHPEVIKVSIQATAQYGAGSGASRLISGNLILYDQLEKELAHWKKTEAALVFATGYMANVGAIPSLVGKGDLIVADKLNHASLIDGCRLSGATFRVYPHKNLERLRDLLKRRHQYQRVLIVTDTLFSMDGDIAPLPELYKIAEEYDAWLYLDEAHATGVLGETGEGALEHWGLSKKEFVIQMGTLSKSVGSLGGFIAASRVMVDYLKNKARSLFYSTALPPSVLAASLKGIELIQREPKRIQKLWNLTKRFRQGVRKMGYDDFGSETPIVPILTGGAEKTIKVAQKLLEEGVYVPAVRPPTVPRNKCRLRLSLMATHTEEQIDHCLTLLGKVL